MPDAFAHSFVAMSKTSRSFPSVESFSPETLDLMSEAFEIAWNFVERSTQPDMAQRSALREALARHIIMSVRNGVTNKVALANFAIGQLRPRTIQSGR